MRCDEIFDKFFVNVITYDLHVATLNTIRWRMAVSEGIKTVSATNDGFALRERQETSQGHHL